MVQAKAGADERFARRGRARVHGRRVHGRVLGLCDGARDGRVDGLALKLRELLDVDAACHARRAKKAFGVGAKTSRPEERDIVRLRSEGERERVGRAEAGRRGRRGWAEGDVNVVEAVDARHGHVRAEAVGEREPRGLLEGLDAEPVEED